MIKPTLHIIGPFHTLLNERFHHCAFSQKVFRFSKMMHMVGYRVVEYSCGLSESEADEKISLMTEEEFDCFYPKQAPNITHGTNATIGQPGWQLFNARLIMEIKKRTEPGDIICHPFANSHDSLISLLGQCFHVESGIGYPNRPFGAFRIFESEAWRHFHWGKDEMAPTKTNQGLGNNKYYTFVIPNYFDLADWPYSPPSINGDYVAYMGRIGLDKGMLTLAHVIRTFAARFTTTGEKPPKFMFAGQGEFDKAVMENVNMDPKPADGSVDIEFIGPITGMKRAEFVGRARCAVMPTEYVEPFGGSGVESMLTGTPLISSNYGAFTETVDHGVTGFRCNTLGDWVCAIDRAKELDRRIVSAVARDKYSLEVCAKMYDSAFKQISEINGLGWNSLSHHRIDTCPI